MCAEPDPVDYEEDSDDLPSNKVASQVLLIPTAPSQFHKLGLILKGCALLIGSLPD